jgi:hypothetical protein
MSRSTSIGADYSSTIDAAATRFGDHEGMSSSRILEWLVQFDDADLPLAARVLDSIKYVNATNIRALTTRLVELVVTEVGTEADVLFVPIGGTPGSGSEIIARALRRITEPIEPRVITMMDLQGGGISPDAIVFVDDFCGTGDSLVEWWATVEPVVRPIGATVVFGALVMLSEAVDRIESLGLTLAVEELGEEADVFHARGSSFSDDEQSTLLNYCQKTSCSPWFLRGYGDSGLLLAFKHGCPDNSLPILWYGDEGWSELFQRRAI